MKNETQILEDTTQVVEYIAKTLKMVEGGIRQAIGLETPANSTEKPLEHENGTKTNTE